MGIAKEFNGKNILEVWDWRLSRGNPILYNSGETWVVRIWANKPKDGEKELLEEWDSGFEVRREFGAYDFEAIKKCYAWLHSVRDRYSRDHIELRKPVAKAINEANSKASEINCAADKAIVDGDKNLHIELKGRLAAHMSIANAEIGATIKTFHKKVAELKGGV